MGAALIVKGMRIGVVLFSLSLLLSACSTERTDARAGKERFSPPAPYVRISNADSNLIELQIALRKFVCERGQGPAIWLTGVSHIGESNYFAAVQKHLERQSLVLFEGITDRASDNTPEASGDASPSMSPGTASLQSAMAASLGLVFQLEAIDYSRASFHNSDLSVRQLRRLLAEQSSGSGANGASAGFESLLEAMQGNSLLSSVMQLGLRFLGASPKLQGMGRLALLELLSEIKGDPGKLPGLDPETRQLLEVLIIKRNQKVMSDLKLALKGRGPGESVAILYGTGHMPDLEQRLGQELHYRPAEQVWVTAFSVNLARSGMSDTECRFIRNFVKKELEELDRE